MTLPISAEQMSIYQATARHRSRQKAEALALRRQRAWEMAQAAGRLLKEEFKARRVVVFGTVLSAERFHTRSDVDLAVWGLAEKDYYRAVARLLDLDTAISIDLVEAELASPGLLSSIEREGIEL